MKGFTLQGRAPRAWRGLGVLAALPLSLLAACARPTPTLPGCGDGRILTLPAARVGQGYVRGARVQGGVPPYASQVTAGSLQAVGLSVTADGQVTGVPVAEGTVVFCIQAREAAGAQVAAQAYRVTVLPRGSAP